VMKTIVHDLSGDDLHSVAGYVQSIGP
jgi:hypothetical protein